MPILCKAIYRSNPIHIKISMTFLIEIEKRILKFIWKHKIPQIATAILSNKSNAGSIKISDVKIDYIAIVTNTAWYRY
jgi:hypothetical protein